MKASRINEFIYAVQLELQKEFQQINGRIENWENEMQNAQIRLLQHQRITDDSTFRKNAMARLESKIELLESRIELFESKQEKIENCISHLPQLKALAKRSISSSNLSYEFKEYYLPVYRKITMNLNLPVTEEREAFDLAILQEPSHGYNRSRRSQEKRRAQHGN